MLIILVISVILLFLTGLLHYHQHFKLHLSVCIPKPRRLSTVRDKNDRNEKHPVSFCLCSLTSKEVGEKYNFFPMSFLCYIVYIIIICLLLIMTEIVDYYHHHNTFHYNLLFSYNIATYHEYQSLFALSSVYLSNVAASEKNGILNHIQDYILIYSVMFLLEWDSLFSFYKYYTTKVVVQQYEITTSKAVTLRFFIYAIIFSAIFITQMQIYYYVWPILLLVHMTFNIVCILKFASLLVNKYQLFIEMDGGSASDDEDENILRSVYLMRTISVLCVVLQTIYLALFTISYTINTIYYLPVLWSMNACIFSLNFVRNRKYLNYKLFQCKQKFRYKFKPSIHRQITGKNLNVLHSNEPQSNPKPQETVTHKVTFSNIKELPLDFKLEEDVKSAQADNERGSRTVSSTVSKEYHGTCDEQLPAAQPQMPRPSFQKTVTKNYSTSINTKALQLLGISSSKTFSKSLICKNNQFIPQKRVVVHSQSDIILTPSSGSQEIFPAPASPIYSKTEPLSNVVGVEHKTQNTNADKVTALENIQYMPKLQEIDETDESKTIGYMPKLPLRRISSPNIKITIENVEYIGDEFDDDDDCVFVDYDKTPDSEPDEADENITNTSKARKATWLMNSSLKHRKSNSVPCGLNDSLNLGMGEMMESLDLFAKYGFCSRSLYQLARYRHKALYLHTIESQMPR